MRAFAEVSFIEAGERGVDVVQDAPLVLQHLHIGIDGLGGDIGHVNWRGGGVGVDVDFFLNGLHDVIDFAASSIAEGQEHVAVSV